MVPLMGPLVSSAGVEGRTIEPLIFSVVNCGWLRVPMFDVVFSFLDVMVVGPVDEGFGVINCFFEGLVTQGDVLG